MPDYYISVTGSEADVEVFRQELLEDMKIAGFPGGCVEISAARRVRQKLTDPSPLGHVEWVEIGVKIIVGVLTPVVADLIKDLVRRRSKAISLETHEHP